LASRGFNIDSLVVSQTDRPNLARMTIAIRGSETTVQQVRRQLEDLVPVWGVLDYSQCRLIQREVCLLRVRFLVRL
jgi:acetolactate synthase-1/3 small subunit